MINNFPKEIAKTDIVNFLKKQGLPVDFDEELVTLNNTKNGATLEISPLENEVVKALIEKIHFIETRTKFFQRPLYCRAMREMTPPKPTEPKKKDAINKNDEAKAKPKEKSKKEKAVSNSDTEPTRVTKPEDEPNSEFEWEDCSENDASKNAEPRSKLFQNGDSSEDEDDPLNDKRKEFLKEKVNKVKAKANKRGRNSSGKGSQKDKKLKK